MVWWRNFRIWPLKVFLGLCCWRVFVFCFLVWIEVALFFGDSVNGGTGDWNHLNEIFSVSTWFIFCLKVKALFQVIKTSSLRFYLFFLSLCIEWCWKSFALCLVVIFVHFVPSGSLMVQFQRSFCWNFVFAMINFSYEG